MRVAERGELVTPTGWSAKLRVVVEKTTPGPVPFPMRDAACRPAGALSVTMSWAVLCPAAVGLKAAEIAQFPPTEICPEHGTVRGKSPAADPLKIAPLKATGVLPGLLIRSVCSAEVLAIV